MLAKRHRDLAQSRAETASRLHALLTELQPGGMAKRMNVTRANGILDTITIDTAIECLLPDTVSLNTGVHMHVRTFWRRPESMVAVRTLGQSTRKTLRNTSQVGIQVQSGG